MGWDFLSTRRPRLVRCDSNFTGFCVWVECGIKSNRSGSVAPVRSSRQREGAFLSGLRSCIRLGKFSKHRTGNTRSPPVGWLWHAGWPEGGQQRQRCRNTSPLLTSAANGAGPVSGLFRQTAARCTRRCADRICTIAVGKSRRVSVALTPPSTVLRRRPAAPGPRRTRPADLRTLRRRVRLRRRWRYGPACRLPPCGFDRPRACP